MFLEKYSLAGTCAATSHATNKMSARAYDWWHRLEAHLFLLDAKK